MNQSVEKGFRWLQANFKLKADDIDVDGEVPALRCRDGRAFAVKKLYGGKVVCFYPGEFEKLVEAKNRERISLLLFNDKDPSPVKEIPARVLKDNREGYQDFVFKHIDGEQGNGNGRIILRLSKRHAESRHYRIGHLPMESLLAWPEGGYKMMKSVGSGKLEFYLELSPNIMA